MKQKIVLTSVLLVFFSLSLTAGARRDQSASPQNTSVQTVKPQAVKASALNGPSGVGMVYQIGRASCRERV